MGKNRRRQLVFKDQVSGLEANVDSQEECDFFAWCEEAMRLGILLGYEYQPEPFKLFDGASWRDAKGKTRCLLREHMYTADFKLAFCPKKAEALAKFFKVPFEHIDDQKFCAYADVKGTFQKSDGGRSFSLNQKWMMQKHNVYVQKTVPKDFFVACGCPQQCFLTQKTKKPRKMFIGMKSISEAFDL